MTPPYNQFLLQDEQVVSLEAFASPTHNSAVPPRTLNCKNLIRTVTAPFTRGVKLTRSILSPGAKFLCLMLAKTK